MSSESVYQDPTWGRMNGWNLVIPPSRPDTLDLARIIEAIKHIDRTATVGVLGSTPEFRDLLYESGFRSIVVLERNLPFFAFVSQQRVYENTEQVVEGNWLTTLPHLTSRFQLILSDLTAGNIPYEKRAEFYSLITGALAPGGIFIDKLLTNENGLISISQIQNRYSRLPINLQTANYFSCEAVFCSELQAARQVIDTTAIYDELSERLPGLRFRKLIRYSQLITPLGCLWYYGRPWPMLQPTYCPELELVARYDLASSQPYYNHGYQCLWRKGKGD
jgi:hypothetical protein